MSVQTQLNTYAHQMEWVLCIEGIGWPANEASVSDGLNGRIFTIYKFRTMIEDAHRRRTEIQHLNEMNGPVFKVKADPRVTGVGRLLRKFTLDELP